MHSPYASYKFEWRFNVIEMKMNSIKMLTEIYVHLLDVARGSASDSAMCALHNSLSINHFFRWL